MQKLILMELYKNEQDSEAGESTKNLNREFPYIKARIAMEFGQEDVRFVSESRKARTFSSVFSQSIRNLGSKNLVELVYKYQLSKRFHHYIKRCEGKELMEDMYKPKPCKDCIYREKYNFYDFWFNDEDCVFVTEKEGSPYLNEPWGKEKRIHSIKLIDKGKELIETVLKLNIGN